MIPAEETSAAKAARLQRVYDEAFALGILERPILAADALEQGVTDARIDVVNGERALIETVTPHPVSLARSPE